VPLQIVLALLVPAAFGALAGWLLTVNETAYLIVAILAIGGGYFAGREHSGAGEGALRGLIGGALFGGFIYLVYKAIDKPAKADLPDPEVLLIALTTVFGVVLGAMGGAATKRKEEEEEKEKTGFSLKRIKPAEYIGFAGAAVLALSLLLLNWFSTSCPSAEAAKAAAGAGGCNPNSKIHNLYGSFTGWETYTIVRWPLLLACLAPFILAYIIARGHALSWRPGEITMIVGMVAFALILLDGIILGRPGGNKRTNVDISLDIGYLVGLIGAFLITYGGFRRQSEDIKAKPPGI
jgi:hypothetical protein